jgi:hypothetical protein
MDRRSRALALGGRKPVLAEPPAPGQMDRHPPPALPEREQAMREQPEQVPLRWRASPERQEPERMDHRWRVPELVLVLAVPRRALEPGPVPSGSRERQERMDRRSPELARLVLAWSGREQRARMDHPLARERRALAWSAREPRAPERMDRPTAEQPVVWVELTEPQVSEPEAPVKSGGAGRALAQGRAPARELVREPEPVQAALAQGPAR